MEVRRLAVLGRGPGALRLVQAARELRCEEGSALTIVAVHEPGRSVPWLREADTTVALGASAGVARDGSPAGFDEPAVEPALAAARADLVATAGTSLAEEAVVVRACERLGIAFAGPGTTARRLLADETAGRQAASELGLPLARRSEGVIRTHAEATRWAERLGLPVRVRALAGGGALARTVERLDDVASAFEDVRVRALAHFGDGAVVLDAARAGTVRWVVQVLADDTAEARAVGVLRRTVHAGCTLEETPAGLPANVEAAFIEASLHLAATCALRGAAWFAFAGDDLARIWGFASAAPGLAGGHAALEEATASDLVKMQLRLGRGERLTGAPRAIRGHAVSVRLMGDTERSAAAGRVELLRLPAGRGIRIDAGVAVGDRLTADAPIVARLTAHGDDRREAVARLERALRDCTAVFGLAVTNKRALLEAVADLGAARSGDDADLGRARVALLAAAVDACDADFAVERAQFLASAMRGRPHVKHEVGVGVTLRFAGNAYAFLVARVGAREYRVGVDGVAHHVVVERLGIHESRLEVDGAWYRVLALGEGHERLVEVDGVPHHVAHDQAGVVRAPGPAVVLAILVEPGANVAAGDRLVVLEAMKMEIPVLAPFAGRVREIVVAPNVQVDAGAPLLVLEPPASAATPPQPRLRFERTAAHAGATSPRTAAWRDALDDARRLMLGFDVDRASAKRLAATWSKLGGEQPAEPGLLAAEAELLDAFATIHPLFRPQRDPDGGGGQATRSVQEYLLTYLRSLDTAGEGLPPSFLAKLERALELYGVRGTTRCPALEEALVRIYRARERAEEQAGLALAILSRLLDRRADVSTVLGDGFRAQLDRLAAVSHGRFPAVGDLARELRYRAYDEPLLERARAGVYAAAERTLALLLEEEEPGRRRELVQELVECPQPLAGMLARRWPDVPPAAQARLLEVLTRRYYRMRELENLRFASAGGASWARAEYQLDDSRIALLATFATLEQLSATLAAAAELVAGVPETEDVLLDVFVRAGTSPADPDVLSGELKALIAATRWPRALRRIVFAVDPAAGGASAAELRHFTFRPGPDGSYAEEAVVRDLHPMMGKRMHLWRLANFAIERLPSAEDVYLFRGVALANAKDERLFALAEVRDLTPVRDGRGRIVQLPELERMLVEALAAIRQQQLRRPQRERLLWNRVLLYVWPPLELERDELRAVVRRLAPLTEGLGLEQVTVRARVPDAASNALVDRVLRVTSLGAQGTLDLAWDVPPTEPLRPLGAYEQKVLSMRRRGLTYPYEIVRALLVPDDEAAPGLPPGEFVEYDLDEQGRLVPVSRPHGQNTAHVVVGVIRNHTVKHPEGMQRVILLGDPSKEMGSVAEPECRRIIEALALARRLHVPVEWFTLSAGAKIAMDSGTENMDWISRVLRHLIEFTQDGHEVNVVVVGINVGAQPYWNAEATMLMHTRGILVMTPESAMVLTGKQALDYSGSVSAEDNQGIGGYERVMGQNGQAQYWAADLGEACRILMRHYEHTYVAPGEPGPRRATTSDPVDRNVRTSPHVAVHDTGFVTVGDVLSEERNAGRKKPFDIRSVMAAVVDRDHAPLERWPDMRDAEIAVVWDAHVGGIPVCMIGMESHPVKRLGFVPADGPSHWTAGTLFPRSSKKIARSINSVSGNRPLVVLANLSGFDGSPESMRNLQLEYGAEIGRAVVNFRGPIVFCVISRYHGGAFVVFSKALNEGFEAAALEGAYASVIGGAPAAAVVFARDVDARTRADARIVALEEEIAAAPADRKASLRARLATTLEAVRSEKLGEVADEFDHVHTVQRALQVGSLDAIVPAARLRPWVVEALERGLAREAARGSS
jgi:acetyl/propionyl-CoA carboxylase alpha subunit/acetyl-CoA carboxylase carboxyltransferase component